MATELSNRETALPHPHNCSDDNYNGVCQVCGFDEDSLLDEKGDEPTCSACGRVKATCSKRFGHSWAEA